MYTPNPAEPAPVDEEAPKPKRKPRIRGLPLESARAAGLRYVYDDEPGITRTRIRKGFLYHGPGGELIEDRATLLRIRKLAIPPAWRKVWICASPNGHLQVTGRDYKGRKQSRYHAGWRTIRDEAKYDRLKSFANALPAIRHHVDHDLKLPGMPREKVLATIVRLMETTFIRVGNPEYARENHSYGLTTMRNKHVEVDGAKVHFTFRGMSGVQHDIEREDRRVAKIIQQCHDIPGYQLFQYLDHDGNHHHIESTDVNEYLRAITNEHFTSKDFRTWAGTVLACMFLQQAEPCDTLPQAKKNIMQSIAAVAERLGNTPAVCRKCYVHPAVLEHYLNGSLGAAAQKLAEEMEQSSDHSPHALRQEEIFLLDLLDRRIERKTHR